MHVLFRYCESPHVRPANAFAYGIRSAVVGIHRCHVLCKIRLPVVVVVVVVVIANEKTISTKGGQSKTHTHRKKIKKGKRFNEDKTEEEEGGGGEEEREGVGKGGLLVTYQPSVRPVGPLLLHRGLEGRPLPRERSHKEEGEAKRGHEVDTRRGRHGGRWVSLRLQSAAPQSQSLSFF